MANLTSSVPGAYDAFYNLIKTAGAGQSPPVAVMAQELVQYEPGSYVCLGATPGGHKAVENHRWEWAALGSFAFYETYDFCGYATVLQGDVDPEVILARTWSLYQAVVMNPIVANRGSNGTNVLGSAAPASLEYIIPVDANYVGVPGNFAGGQEGFQGIVEFCFSVKARITTA